MRHGPALGQPSGLAARRQACRRWSTPTRAKPLATPEPGDKVVDSSRSGFPRLAVVRVATVMLCPDRGSVTWRLLEWSGAAKGASPQVKPYPGPGPRAAQVTGGSRGKASGAKPAPTFRRTPLGLAVPLGPAVSTRGALDGPWLPAGTDCGEERGTRLTPRISAPGRAGRTAVGQRFRRGAPPATHEVQESAPSTAGGPHVGQAPSSAVSPDSRGPRMRALSPRPVPGEGFRHSGRPDVGQRPSTPPAPVSNLALQSVAGLADPPRGRRRCPITPSPASSIH